MRPEVNDINELLRSREALLVHFSGVPKMDDLHLYPTDLQHIIEGNMRGGLSCSTVRPSDTLGGSGGNAIGSVGVIVGLRTKDSLVGAFREDCGSRVDMQGCKTCPRQVSLSIADVRDTIDSRPVGQYNEWVVKDFEVLGMFVADPFEITIEIALGTVVPEDFPDELKSCLERIPGTTTPLAVSKQFAPLRSFGFHQQRLCEWRNGLPIEVAHKDIYPTA